jgi:hypothetical protein
MTPLDYAFLCLCEVFLFFGATVLAYWIAGEPTAEMA